MAIGILDRSWLDKAQNLWSAYVEADKKLTPKAKEVVSKIAGSRDEINQRISVLTSTRRLAVQKRDADARLVSDFPKRSSDIANTIEQATKDLSSERKKLEELRKTEAEGVKRRDNALEAAKQQEKDLSALMGRGDMETPWSDKPVPELEPKVREWAENFVRLKKEKTIAYFKAESEKFGALIDLRKVRTDIADCENRIVALEEKIDDAKKTLEELTRSKVVAKEAEGKNQEDVLNVQKAINDENGLLANHAYAEHLQELVGSAKEAALSALREARAEAQENLTRILSEIRSAQHPAYSQKVTKALREFEDGHTTRDKALKSLKFGADFPKNVELLRGEADLAQTLAKKIDTYVAKDLLVAAENARLNNLRMDWRPKVFEEVSSRRNIENGKSISARQLYIDDDILKGISKSCDPSVPVVSEALIGPLLDAAEEAYDRALETFLKEELKKSANLAEENRLKALDAVGNEPEFAKLPANRKRSVIAPYKGMPAVSATPEIVREALREALRLQLTPSIARWRSILGLPSKIFFDAKSFTDSSGETYKVHISFFESAVGPNANSGIGVYKSEDTKYTADEVMQMIFEDDIEEIFRAHATLELENNSGAKPHVYVGGLAINFVSTFTDKVATKPEPDTAWATKAEQHCAKALSDQMSVIHGKVKTWLDKDGAV